MTESKNASKTRRSVVWRIGKIVLIIISSLVGLVIVLALLLLTPPVQNFARQKAQVFLSNKLKTKFEIGRIYIGFPKKIVLEDVYIEDRQKDTLLSGGLLKVDISMMKLLKSELEISEIDLEDITARVKRTLPDTVFNFQFILDAFAPKNPTAAAPQDTSAMKMAINEVNLDRINVTFLDDVTGNDVKFFLQKFSTTIDRFDPAHMDFAINNINLEGVRATVKQVKPLVEANTAAQDSAEAAEPINIKLKLGDVALRDIKLNYGNDVSSFYTVLDLGELNLKPEAFDFANNTISFGHVELNNTSSFIRMGKTAASAEVAKQAEQEVESQAQQGWKFIVNTIRLNNDHLRFDNDNEPKAPSGIDYAHLDADKLTLHVDDLYFQTDSITGRITRGTMVERSGFVLNKLQTEFMYGGRQSYLKDLLIETPGTRIQRSAIVTYPSLEAVSKNIGTLGMNIDLTGTKVQVKDILVFAPMLKTAPGFSNPNAQWILNGRVNGTVSNMRLQDLDIRGLNNTRLAATGTISGLPDMNKLRGNIRIRELRTNRGDLALILPAGSIPSTITLPETMSMSGTLAGSMQDAKANLALKTNLGSAAIDGTIRNATDQAKASYSARINTTNIQLGTIMQNDTLYGPLSLTMAVSGRGLEPKSMRAEWKGVVHSAVYNKYTYKELALNGSYDHQRVKAFAGIQDPNVALALNAEADLAKEFPSVRLNGTIDSIKLDALHFLSQPLYYHGIIDADFPNTDPKNLEGRMLVKQSVVATATQRFELDTIELAAGKSDTGKFVTLHSDIANLALTGQYDLAQLGDVFVEAVQPYYAIIPDYKPVNMEPYDFRFSGQLLNAPMLQAFVPDLKRLDPVNLNGHFSDSGWHTVLTAPMIVYGTNSIHNLSLNAGTGNGVLSMRALLDQVVSGGMHIYKTGLDATIANNAIDFLTSIQDANKKNKYRFGANFKQTSPESFTLILDPKVLLLNYDAWTVPGDNVVRLDRGDINIHNLVLAKNEQRLSLNSVSAERNSPLNIQFNEFRIATLTAFMKQDTLIADGRINGTAQVVNFTTQPVFTSDLAIHDLSIQKDTVGNLTMKVNNNTSNEFVAQVNLTGNGNDLLLNGTYFVRPENKSSFDLNLDIKQLQMRTIEKVSMGAIAGAKGFIDGNFKINGTVDKPDVDGHLDFNQTAFTLSAINSYYQIDKESILVDEQGFRFNKFSIKDSSNNELNIDGVAKTSNFVNYELDLDITADNFKAVNSTKRNNQLFYGALNFDTDLHISGTELSPKVDGSLTINDKTNFTIVLPQSEPGVVARDGIVRFVDQDSMRIDTLLYASIDSLKKSKVQGMDVAVNIEINKEAIFNIVVDESNGDFLHMKGEAVLSAGIDPSGNVTLTGSYEINEGAYELSFNFLKRRFEILKGSKITWLGEPTKADVNVTAIYTANTAPLSLVEDQLGPDVAATDKNRYKQKLPFKVNLMVKGELMKPDISFDVILPEDKSYNVATDVVENVETRLTALRTEPSELNKQVFALLLLGRFV
ncbi:MAG TPA: translocation/assembly module TamB domain-containing protein, partial [Flavitalea sp.]|nr:translocation/assembly module TamB domain-containing protein [Flavitalea sp.]